MKCSSVSAFGYAVDQAMHNFSGASETRVSGQETSDPGVTTEGAVRNDVGIDCGAFSSGVKVSAQAARSIG